jgi:glycosyltransferase involved in cell wall biosynthesis
MTGRTAASVTFICDFPPGFTGANHHGSGVGGTEAMVVVLAEALAANGIAVRVLTRVLDATETAGVRYEPVDPARAPRADAVVLVKRWSDAAAQAAGTRVFVATDVHVPDPRELARSLEWAHVSAALSPFMRSRLTAVVAAPGMQILTPPLTLSDYASVPEDREPLLLYCSMPDRGLYYLKDIFPAIRRQVPGATLAITSDFTLWGKAPAKDAFMRFFKGERGVTYLGHVDRAVLIAEQRRARVMAYPCTFEEGFCIAAAECMAAGAVPVTTGDFALTTTVGDAGVLVRGRPRSWFYRRAFVKAAVRLLREDAYWQERSRACRQHAATWGAAATADRLLTLARGANRE